MTPAAVGPLDVPRSLAGLDAGMAALFLPGEYIADAGIAADTDGPLFRTTGRTTGTPQRMTQPDAHRVIQRRVRAAGIETKIGNHSLRATGITDYLKNNGTPEHAQAMGSHSSPRTTKLYDRRSEEITLDEYEKVGI